MAYYIFSVDQLIRFANGDPAQGQTLSTPDNAGTASATVLGEAAALNAVVNGGYSLEFISGYGPMKEYYFQK